MYSTGENPKVINNKLKTENAKTLLTSLDVDFRN